MKYVNLILLFISISTFAQKTYVPDDNFEQALIDLGVDDVLDDSVLTGSIEGIEELNVSSLDISDLTGIEGFFSLILLDCYGNNLDSLALGSNTALQFLNFTWNNINDLDLSANVSMRELACSGNEMDELDLTNLIDLRELNGYGNNLTAVDFSNCPLLEIVSLGANLFTHLDFSNNPNLTFLNCADNNVLIYLSVKNGNNTALETYNSTYCPRLNCIEVDDPAYSETAWLEKDPFASYSLNCGLSIEVNNKVEISIYPNPASDQLNVRISIDQLDYKLMDLSGKLIATGNLSQGINLINVSMLLAGIYFLEVEGDGYVATYKTVVK